MREIRRAAIVCAIFALLSGYAGAESLATVGGYVRDNAQHLPLAGARISLTLNGVTLQTVSDDRGFYSFSRLEPATYTITAEAVKIPMYYWILPRPIHITLLSGESKSMDLFLQWHSELEGFRMSDYAVRPGMQSDLYRSSATGFPFFASPVRRWELLGTPGISAAPQAPVLH